MGIFRHLHQHFLQVEISKKKKKEISTWYCCVKGYVHLHLGLPRWLYGQGPSYQCRRPMFNPLVRKIPWRRAWQPTQYSCLENPMDRGAWRATIYRVTESGTWLKWLSMHARTLTFVTCRVKHEAYLTAHLTVRVHSVFPAPRKWVLRGVSVWGVLLWNSCQQQEEVWVVVKPSKTWQFVGILFLPLIRIKLTLFKREGRSTPPPAQPRPAIHLQKWYPNTISRRQ